MARTIDVGGTVTLVTITDGELGVEDIRFLGIPA